jgi:hypothetical protein
MIMWRNEQKCDALPLSREATETEEMLECYWVLHKEGHDQMLGRVWQFHDRARGDDDMEMSRDLSLTHGVDGDCVGGLVCLCAFAALRTRSLTHNTMMNTHTLHTLTGLATLGVIGALYYNWPRSKKSQIRSRVEEGVPL